MASILLCLLQERHVVSALAGESHSKVDRRTSLPASIGSIDFLKSGCHGPSVYLRSGGGASAQTSLEEADRYRPQTARIDGEHTYGAVAAAHAYLLLNAALFSNDGLAHPTRLSCRATVIV